MTTLTIEQAADLLKIREEDDGGYVRVIHATLGGDHTGIQGGFWKTERVFEVWREHGVELMSLDKADQFFGCCLKTTVDRVVYQFGADMERVAAFQKPIKPRYPNKCVCDLRNRQWNPNTGHCEFCGCKYVDRRFMRVKDGLHRRRQYKFDQECESKAEMEGDPVTDEE